MRKILSQSWRAEQHASGSKKFETQFGKLTSLNKQPCSLGVMLAHRTEQRLQDIANVLRCHSAPHHCFNPD